MVKKTVYYQGDIEISALGPFLDLYIHIFAFKRFRCLHLTDKIALSSPKSAAKPTSFGAWCLLVFFC